MANKRIIIGMSGADGAVLGVRLLSILRDLPDVETFLVMSESAKKNAAMECGIGADEIAGMADRAFDVDDLSAAISSGSFYTDGMIVAPCSMKTLSAIAHGFEINLLVRAADVCLKEGRKVVIMPREAPLAINHIKKEHAVCGGSRMRHSPAYAHFLQPAGEPGRHDKPRPGQSAGAIRNNPAGLQTVDRPNTLTGGQL